MGRRPLPKAQRKTKKFSLNLSEEEVQLVHKAAAIDDLKPYIWGRREIMKAVRLRLSTQDGRKPTSGK